MKLSGSEPDGSRGVPSVLIKPMSQVRREAAGGTDQPTPSILPKSAAHVRREAAAKIRAEEEAAAILRRAAAAKAEREAEAARKAAEAKRAEEAAKALEVRRAAHKKACQREMVIRATLPMALSKIDRQVFALLVVRYTDAGNKAVKLPAADVAKALDIREDKARKAIESLREHGVIVDVTDSFGVTKLMPAAHAVAAVVEGARKQ